MDKEAVSSKIEEQILRSLREYYPIKADEVVIISAVQKAMKNISPDEVSQEIRFLRDQGWLEESVVKAPFGMIEAFRFKITSSGIRQLQALETRELGDLPGALSELEARLADTHNHLKVDMERDRKDLEGFIRAVDNKVEDLSKQLAEFRELMDSQAEKAEDEKTKEEQILLRVLTGDEKLIYVAILEVGGEMLQKDLVKRSKMSNAKVSRIVDRLESRGILVRERYGATNRLRIVVKSSESTSP